MLGEVRNLMGKKQTTQQTQNQSYNNQNTYGQITPTDTPDIAAMRDFQFNVDPAIASTYGAARQRVNNSFNNPIGGAYSPNMKDAMLRSSNRDLSQQQAEAHSSAFNQNQGQQFGQKAAVAGMTAPRILQTGSSGTGNMSGNTVQSQPFDWAGLAGGVATGAAA